MFRKYEYVYMLYREGSFTRAAEKLFISQPSLSVAIQNVEKDLGAVLFERTGSGVTPTEAGLAYINAVQQVMQIEKDLRDKILDLNSLEAGHITVGGSNYLSSYVLPKVINAFSSRFPKVKVELVEANSHTLLELLRQDLVDVIVDNYDDSENIAYPLLEEKILLCVPKQYSVNRSLEACRIQPDDIYSGAAMLDTVPCVPMEAFRNEKFILLKPENDMYRRARSVFEKNNMDPEVVFSVDQLNIAYALSASGNGLTFVTDTFFKYGRFRDDVYLYRPDSECSRKLCIAHRRNKYCSRAMREFIKTAGEVVK